MRYAIIGAGALGLTAGLRLAQRGHSVSVFERGAELGGLASSFEVAPGIWLERFYHHLFRTDKFAIDLIGELGLGGELRWSSPATTYLVRDRAWQLDSPTSLLRFEPLPLLDRLRLGFALARLKVLSHPGAVEDEGAVAWMTRHAGRRSTELIWRPLLEAKFGAHYEGVSMAWLWARIHDRTRELGYVHRGFQRVYNELGRAVVGAGGTLRLGVTVGQIVPECIEGGGGALRIGSKTPNQEVISEGVFDRVVSTLPDVLTSKMTSGLWTLGEASASTGAKGLAAHCLILAMDRPLTGRYWIGVGDRDWPFLAVVEHTAMVSPDEYAGNHLVYLGAYRDPGDPVPAWSTDRQLDLIAPFLKRLNAAFSRDWITNMWSFYAPLAQPVVGIGYRRSIPGFNTPLHNLFRANMFQVFPHDRGQNYSIELAERLVRHLERETA